MPDSGPADPPFRIALCITELQVGGAEKCLVELATRLDRSRFLPAVISLAPRPPEPQSQLLHRLNEAGIPVRFLNQQRPRQFFQAVRRLTDCLNELQPDLLQTFLFHADVVGGQAARRRGGRERIPHVAGIRVADPRSRLRQLAQRFLTRSTARYVCVSHDVAEFAAGQLGLPRGKLTVIPNGIDVAPYQTAPPLDLKAIGVPEGRKILLFVGRLEQQKRPDRLVALMQRLKHQHPPCHLIVVGTGPLRGPLEMEVAQAQLTTHVHFAGWQPNVKPYLATADILLLTSAWEGMPNIVLEAMAAGKPVVCCDCEGVGELLGAGAAGQVIPQAAAVRSDRLAAQLAERVRQITTDDQLAASLSRANQQRAGEHFTWQKMVDAYQQLYLSLLPKREPRT